MEIATTAADLIALLPSFPNRILVPTMGALHDGHMELIRLARQHAGSNGSVMVSIFVNPIQFDRPSDLASYPRPLDEDLAKCKAAGVDVVFAPEANSMYHPDRSITVTESLLSSTLCGATRPGHFDGVCTVVLKLFMLSACTAAVFGEKDFQQLAIIRRMVRDLNLPVTILECPTIRESDGLALSSRNSRLSPEHRADAPRLYQALTTAAQLDSASAILHHARTTIEASTFTRIDYLELVNAETLQTTTDLSSPCVLATAVFYGDVRLIDHVSISAHS